MTAYQIKQKQKSYWIPLCCKGAITERNCAKMLNMSEYGITLLKRRYRQKGKLAFVNGHKNKKYANKKYSDSFINRLIDIYKKDWPDAPIATFCESLKTYYHIEVCYNIVLVEFKKRGIKPPRTWSCKEKAQHKKRDERENEGELLQMDASTHDWFMNGEYEAMHGGIDDATHTVTGLYLCLNECRLGYNEVQRQTWLNYGYPQAYYIDRHSSFVKNDRKTKTLTERLEYSKDESTHFTDLCRDLEIEVILALSPQAKGRIERLWQTLQGKLPYIFRYLHIDTIEAANAFLVYWLVEFNRKYSRIARSGEKLYRPLPADFDIDYGLSVKFSCRTDSLGFFTFHDCDFRLMAPLRAYKKFELCLSEQFGLRAYMEGKWYSVTLAEPFIQDTVGDKMPQVEKHLIARYLLNDLHSDTA